MKKLIAISVVFALVAGVAFAADVSGGVIGKIEPIAGDTGKDATGKKNEVHVGGSFGRVRLEAAGQDDNGAFGGWTRFDTSWGSGVNGWGLVWWKPLDIFKFQIGGNPDGHFGADGMTRWGFYQGAGDAGVTKEGWAFGSSFYGGFGDVGAILTLTPIEALEVNIGIPFIKYDSEKAADFYKRTNAQFAYTIDGTGKLAVTYAGGLGDEIKPKYKTEDDDTTPIVGYGGNGAKLYGFFGLTAIENLEIDIGLGYTLPAKMEGATYNAPIAAGVGAAFSADAFGVKARVQGQFAGNAKPGNYKDPMVIDFDVLPYFNVSDALVFYFDAGTKVSIPDEGDNVIGWHVNPYVVVQSNFYAGIRIESDGQKQGNDPAVVKWSVPVAMAFSF